MHRGDIVWARLLTIMPFVLAAIVLAGWTLALEPLKRFWLPSVTMNPAAAAAFLLISTGLAIRFRAGRVAAASGTILIGVAGFIGAMKLADLVAGTHFAIDARLFASALAAGYARPSQMAPNTAGCFVLVSIAVLLMNRRSERAVITAQAMAFVVSLIAGFAIVGHLYGVTAFYVVAALHPMALHSAAAFLCLAAFIMLETAQRGLVARISDPGPAGRSARALLPAGIIIPVVFGWVRQEGETAGLYGQEIGVAVMVMLTMLCMTVLTWLNAGWLLASDKLRRRAEAEIAHMAKHDFLTGLPNRAQFMDSLVARMVPRRRYADASFAVVTMDLDGFKQVNDRFGHAAGDALLRDVAVVLQDCVYRSEDLVARLGGDEFAMLLDRINCADEAGVIATRIVASMPRRFGPEGREIPIGISVGIVIAAAHHETPEALLSEADEALYYAKRNGKGRFSVFPVLQPAAAAPEHTVPGSLHHTEWDTRRLPEFERLEDSSLWQSATSDPG